MIVSLIHTYREGKDDSIAPRGLRVTYREGKHDGVGSVVEERWAHQRVVGPPDRPVDGLGVVQERPRGEDEHLGVRIVKLL